MSILLLALALKASDPQPDPPPTIPAGAWQVGPDGDRRCAARASLDPAVAVVFRTTMARDQSGEIVLAKTPGAAAPTRPLSVVVDWRTYVADGEPIDGGSTWRVPFAPAAIRAWPLGTARMLIVKQGDARLASGMLEQPNGVGAAMTACLNALDRSDVGSGKPAATEARFVAPNPPITSDDYPSAALHDGTRGTVRYRVAISASGFVSDCTIVAGSGTPILDETTCRLLRQRARFDPARDADGQPTASEREANVIWMLPQ